MLPASAEWAVIVNHDNMVMLTMMSSCPTYKSLSEPEVHIQQELEESRGILLRVFLQDGFCIAAYDFGAIALLEDLEPKLRPLVGHKIACLRLDGQYYVRDLEAKNAA